jgi:hypothetical protein
MDSGGMLEPDAGAVGCIEESVLEMGAVPAEAFQVGLR